MSTISQHLLRIFFCHSTHLTGTLDRNRRGVPKQVKDIFNNLSAASAPRGSGAYVRDDETAYAVWKDTKCMSVLSTKHPGHSENKVQRNTKGSDGSHLKTDVPIPETIYQYNKYMGGVDRSDQLIMCSDKQKVLENIVFSLY